MCSRIFWFFIFLASPFLSVAQEQKAKEKKSGVTIDQMREIQKMGKIVLPNLPAEFILDGKSGAQTNLEVTRPCHFGEPHLVMSARYYNEKHLFTYVARVSYNMKYSDSVLDLSDKALDKEGLALISKRKKIRGFTNGVVYQFDHYLNGEQFRKWVAVFGNDFQVACVVGLYPRVHDHFFSDIMLRIALFADLDYTQSAYD